MGILQRVWSWISVDAFTDRVSSSDNYMCAACRTTYARQHVECPTCGSQILVPIEQTGEGGGSGGGPVG